MTAERLRAWLLIAPLFALVAAGLLLPLAGLLWRAVENDETPVALTRTAAALQGWDGLNLPEAPVFAALFADLKAASDESRLGGIARRLNYKRPGMRQALLTTARLTLAPGADLRAAMIAARPEWADLSVWRFLVRQLRPFTPLFLLNAVDLTLNGEGDVTPVPVAEALFRDVFARTAWIAAIVTVICLIAAYPAAYLMATAEPRAAAIALACVLIPFWTALLVRTTAWFVLLQNEGPLNATLIWLGVVEQPVQMIFTRFAVVIAMVHVTLPFVILPIYAVMKRVDPRYLGAAASLGAPPWTQFRRVYFPLTFPGVSAAAVASFVTCLGFYITPALVGGERDQLIGYFIAFFTNRTINFPMAAALATTLLIGVILIWGLVRLSRPALIRAFRA
jgi:putative spermidine/putrescine transport system permease protein